MIAGYGMLAFRDPYGIRPLCIGKNEAMGGSNTRASESVALEPLGFSMLRDVAPGEAIFVDQSGAFTRASAPDNPMLNPCIFEYVYLARPDSVLGRRVGVRDAAADGRGAGRKIRHIPKRSTSTSSSRSRLEPARRRSSSRTRWASSIAKGSSRNRYIGRTFIMPGQAMRKKSVRPEAQPDRHGVQGQGRAASVDDSIVRGTTSREIVSMAREAGARKVYFASASPAGALSQRLRHRHAEPARARRDRSQRGRDRARDRRRSADLSGSGRAQARVRAANPALDEFEASCFDGKYITGDITADYLSQLAHERDEQRGESEDLLDDMKRPVAVD
jgi:amidophosphoribosyltransferase